MVEVKVIYTIEKSLEVPNWTLETNDDDVLINKAELLDYVANQADIPSVSCFKIYDKNGNFLTSRLL